MKQDFVLPRLWIELEHQSLVKRASVVSAAVNRPVLADSETSRRIAAGKVRLAVIPEKGESLDTLDRAPGRESVYRPGWRLLLIHAAIEKSVPSLHGPPRLEVLAETSSEAKQS